MTDRLIKFLKNKKVYTPRLAIVRFLLAFGMLLTVLCNRLDVVANHNYTRLPAYSAKHTTHASVPFKKADLFLMMNPETARWVVVGILLLVMTGLLPQFTCLLHFWACFSVHNYFLILNGGDELAFILSLLLIPVCLADPRFNQWKQKEITPSAGNIVANVTLYFIQLQCAWLYFDAGFFKISRPQWQDGTAVYYYTSHYRLGAVDWVRHINELVTLTPLVKIVTWGVLLLEMGLAICLFLPARIKKKFIIPAIIFHLLIVVNFGLITFFIAELAMILLYLDTDDLFSSKIYNRKKAVD